MTNELDTTPLEQDELANLKDRANKLGIKYNANIGLDKLRNKVNMALTDPKEPMNVTTVPLPLKETKQQRNARLHRESSKLIRVNVVCMDPNKKEYTGEVITVSNSAVGTFKKFIQFNTDDGYHIPQIIYKHLKEKKCQVFHNVKAANGVTVKRGKLIPAFAIEVLAPLTEVELKDLATQQAMAKGQI